MKKKSFFPQSHTNVIRSLLGKAKHKTKVIYVPGNHDSNIRQVAGHTFGNVEIHRNYVYQTLAGKTYFVTHGDEFDATVAISPFLKFIGTVGYDTLVFINNRISVLRKLLGLSEWSLVTHIKKKTRKAHEYARSFEIFMADIGKRKHCDGVICGHIHMPRNMNIAQINYLNTGDWTENCSAIVESENGHMSLIDWRNS